MHLYIETVAMSRFVASQEMGFGKNNVLHANHFRKDWQSRVKTWFDQPGRKTRRRQARSTKATALGARPVKSLRPAVRCPTVRYNTKVREGKGFTLQELKLAGVGKKEARGLGISVDHRRRGGAVVGQEANVERLKAYRARLIVFPRKAGKPKSGDSAEADLSAETTRAPIPLPTLYEAEKPRAITAEEKEFNAFRALRDARATGRNAGKVKARAEKKAAEEAAAKK
ncbi:60s ribosomal protein l13 [Phaffia rhodozyma]|uniref:60S ribosomal protein L13 n=1 Tax=Phaffia rhodozyma TaxID=264483 RepID=A0A0F7SPD5_PHARH|nr:60s ribosomal protein l13 [Phaffia rhodozyma]